MMPDLDGKLLLLMGYITLIDVSEGNESDKKSKQAALKLARELYDSVVSQGSK